MSKLFKIFKSFLFIILSVLLSISLFSEKIPALNLGKEKLRRLGDATVIFDILHVLDGFFIPFLVFHLIWSLIIVCYATSEEAAHASKEELKNYNFFWNNICYIISISYLVISCINFINDVHFGYSVFVFTVSVLYILIRSIIYICFASKGRAYCFAGICEWGYLKLMYTAGCLFFQPCENKEVREIFSCSGNEGCDGGKCCVSTMVIITYLINILLYYPGLLIYSLFWMIGKFFVYISCCDCCWCKEEYDMDFFRFNGTGDTPLNINEDDDKEEKEIKKKINEVKKDTKKTAKKIFSDAKKSIKKFSKKNKK